VVYDAHGVQRYVRLDQAPACHDIVWDGENLVAVSPFSAAEEVPSLTNHPTRAQWK
jgi:hypothetical protein